MARKNTAALSGIVGLLQGIAGGVEKRREEESRRQFTQALKAPKAQGTVDPETAAAFFESIGQGQLAQRTREEAVPVASETLKIFKPAISAQAATVRAAAGVESREDIASKKLKQEQEEEARRAKEASVKAENDALTEARRSFFGANAQFVNEAELLKTGSAQDINNFNAAVSTARDRRGLTEAAPRIGEKPGELTLKQKAAAFIPGVDPQARPEFFINEPGAFPSEPPDPRTESLRAILARPAGSQNAPSDAQREQIIAELEKIQKGK